MATSEHQTERYTPRAADLDRFTEGDCHYLAWAICKLTGWQLCAFDGDYDDAGDMHAFVRTPDGRILDIEGLWTEEDFIAYWRLQDPELGHIKPFVWEVIRKAWGNGPDYGHYTYERARILARRLLNHFYPDESW